MLKIFCQRALHAHENRTKAIHNLSIDKTNTQIRFFVLNHMNRNFLLLLYSLKRLH